MSSKFYSYIKKNSIYFIYVDDGGRYNIVEKTFLGIYLVYASR